jgi:hypothetical protein
LQTFDTGPITNHVNIVRNANGRFKALGGGSIRRTSTTPTPVQPAVAAGVGRLMGGSR